MGIIVRRNEIEQDEPEKTLDIDQGSFDVAVNDPGALFVTGLVVFVVGSCVVFGISQQGREILLLVFPPVMDIEPARNICRIPVVEKTQAIGCRFDAVYLGSNLHRYMLIGRAILPIDDVIAGGPGFQNEQPLLPFTGIPQRIKLVHDNREFGLCPRERYASHVSDGVKGFRRIRIRAGPRKDM